MEEKEDKKKEKDEVKVVEVTTQTELQFQLPTGEVVNMIEYLSWMGNLVYKISKATV